jgi:hypothetical protein
MCFHLHKVNTHAADLDLCGARNVDIIRALADAESAKEAQCAVRCPYGKIASTVSATWCIAFAPLDKRKALRC